MGGLRWNIMRGQIERDDSDGDSGSNGDCFSLGANCSNILESQN